MPSLADIEVSPKKGYSLLSISKGRSLEDIDKPKGRSLADIDSSGTSLADAKAQIYALSPATQKPSNLSDTYTPSPNPQQITAEPTLDPAAIQTAMARVQAGAPPLGREQLYAQSPIMQALHKPLARPEPSGPVIGPATGKEKLGPAGVLPSQRYFSEEMRRQRIPEQYQQQIDQRSLGHEFSAGGVRGIASMLAGANANLAAAATEVGLDKLAQNRMKAAEKIRYFMSQPKYAATRPDVGQIANPRDALHWIAGGAGQMMPLALASYIATVAGGPSAGATLMAGAETGDIYQEVYEKDKSPKGATVAAAHGVVAGLLDYIPVLRIFNKMGVDDTVKREAKRHILRRVPKEIIKQAATEGLTEGAQTVIEQAALEWVDKNHKLFSDENIREVINATAMGIAVGGLTGGAAAPFMGGQTSSEKGVTPNAVENPPATQLYGDVGQQAGPSQAQIVGPQTGPQVNRIGIPQGGQEAQVQEAVTPPPPVQEPLPATAGAQAEIPAGPQKITEFSAKHRQSGQTALLTDVAEEISASAKRSVESTWESAKSAKNIAKRIVLRGTRWMETLGPSGRRISDEIKQVDQRASKRSKNQQWDTRNLLKNFSKKQRERIARLAEKAEPRTQGPLQDAADKLTVILDKDMFEAKAVDLKRKGKPIAGSGHPFPQIPNEAGKKWLDKVERKGMADPEVAKTVNDMVETGQAPDTDAAILRLREYRNNLLRGVNPYFERERTITLPIKYREWDPAKVLPTLFERNALTIEGVRQWGNEHERLAPLLEAVGQESGDRANAHIIDSYMKQNFDVGGMISKEDQALAGAMSNYQTLTRLGGSLLSAIRNMGQRMTNTVRYPIGIQLKAIKDYPPIANKFMKSAERIKERMERTGAIRTATVLSEIENTAPGHRITNLSMKAFKEVETGNQIHSAIVAGYGLEKDLELYAALSNKSRIRQIMDTVLSFGDKSPSAIKRRLRTSQLSNMSDEQMANLLAKQNNTMTMGQLEEALSRFVSDTQFPQTLATKRIWWDSHPWMRLMAKFKTFGIEQTGMIYRHVVQETAKGNFAPMMRFVIWTALMGELYNILRDWITGREESVTSQIRNDAEVKQIVWHIAKNFADGGGIGMLADLVWGIGDYLGGPVYSTLKNGKRATGDIIRDPSAHQVVMSIRDFFSREVSVSKQVSGIINHIDQQINQDNNTYFGYQKWRQRAIDYQKKKKDGISDKVAGIIEGHPQYERTERTNKYEYAANQITAGDIDDAVDYLVMVMKNAETDDDKRNIIKGIKLSMKAKSPLGSVAEKDQSEFLSKYSPNEKKEAISYNQKWIKRYEEAMIKAEKQAWGGAIKQSGKKTKRRGTRALPKRIR